MYKVEREREREREREVLMGLTSGLLKLKKEIKM
jgi:hypothetical protein